MEAGAEATGRVAIMIDHGSQREKPVTRRTTTTIIITQLMTVARYINEKGKIISRK